MEVLVFCGLQASGKSTYYHEYFSLTHLLISKDLMGQTKYKEQHQRELLLLYYSTQRGRRAQSTARGRG